MTKDTINEVKDMTKNTRVGCHSFFQEDLPDLGIKLASFTSPALAGRFFTTSTTWETL